MRSTSVIILMGALAAVASGQTSFPMITHVTPVAVQRGQTSEVKVECKSPSSLHGAYKALFDAPGLTAEFVVTPGGKDTKAPMESGKAPTLPVIPTATMKVTVGSEAPLGMREFRIACQHGISSLGTLLVVDDPVVNEKPGINEPGKAQPISVPSVVCGRIESAENVDYYKFRCHAGQVITIEAHGARLQDKIHDLQKHLDPYIAVYDSSGRELAANDDYYFADPLLTFTAAEEGDYLVAIRDAKFDGDPRWAYALTITDRPYASQTYPLAVNPGRETILEPVGTARRLQPTWPLLPPNETGIYSLPLTYPGGVTNAVPIVVTQLPLVNEQEPNNQPKNANRIEIPCGINGRIGEKFDLDHFVFKGSKGKAIRFEVFARRFGTELRSQLDSQIDILNDTGRILASNDDTNGKDSAIIFTPPSDGDYVLRIRDLNNKGGDGFVYFVEVDWSRPDFTIKCDPSKAMIGPGSRTVWYPIINRLNGFNGPVRVEVRGLPAGIGVNPLTIPENMTTGCLVLSAETNAAIDASRVEVVGIAEAKDENDQPVTLKRTATAVEEIYLPGGGRGRFDVGLLAAAVTTPSDILDVQVKPNRITLKPGQEVKIDVAIKRRADYDKAVTLDILLRHLAGKFADPLPPGITMVDSKSKTLLGTGNAGHIILKAAADAPECTDIPIAVQAFVPINFVVKIGYASEPIYLSVKK